MSARLQAQGGSDDPVYSADGARLGGASFAPSPWESIDTVNGNLLLTFTDLVLPGNAGFNLAFQRSYNSTGGGWRFGLAGLPLETSRNEPTPPTPPSEDYLMPSIVTFDGAKHQLFWKDGVGSGPTLITKEFWKYDYPTHVLQLPNGVVCQFEPTGPGATAPARLAFAHDAFGNSVTFDYSVPGTLTIAQGLGNGQARTIHVAYSGTTVLSLVTSITVDELNRTWTYNYGAQGLETVVPPAGPGWSFGYDPVTLRLTSMTTPNGGVVNYAYDSRTFDKHPNTGTITKPVVTSRTTGGSLPTGTWSFTWTQDGSATTVDGPTTSIVYEPDWAFGGANAGSRTIRQGGSVLEVERLTYGSVVVGYDTLTPGEVPLVLTREVQRGSALYTTTNAYSQNNYADYAHPNHVAEDGDLHRTTDISYSHDDAPYIAGRPSSVTVTVGGQAFTTAYEYDPDNGFLLSEDRYGVVTQFGNDGFGNRNAVNDANNHTTFYSFTWGVVENTTTPEFAISRSINADGTVASETQRGKTTSYGYDDLGRVTSVTPPAGDATVTSYAGNGASVTVTRGASSTTTSLDGFGRATGTADAVGVLTSASYDAIGRKTFQSYPYTGSPIGDTFTYDGLNRVERVTHSDGTHVDYSYDGTNVTITDENGHATLQRWEAFAQPSDARLASVRDAKGQEWSYTYNALGSLTQVDSPAGPARTWTYDAQNRLGAESQPESGATTYGYDSVGNLTVKDDAQGRHFTYGYDGNNRLTSMTGPGISVGIGYDAADNRTSFTSPGASTTFGYDDADRMTRRTDNIDGKTFETTLEYDGRDNVTRVNYPSGRSVCYGYDAANRVAFANACNNPVYAANVAYHPSGAIAGYDAGNGTWESVTFDGRARPKAMKSFKPGGSTVMDLFYSYDSVGNVTGMDENVQGHGSTYGYDELDRLTSVLGYGAMSFDYDALGNRLHKGLPGGTVTYTYAGNLRLASTADPTGGENGSYGYDNVGNTTSDPTGATYEYNAFNMMTKATTIGTGQTTYAYDADNLRTVKSNTDGTEYYVHGPGGQLLAEYRATAGAPALVREYIYLGSRLLASYAQSTGGSGFAVAGKDASPAPTTDKPTTSSTQLPPRDPKVDPTESSLVYNQANPAGLPIDMDGDNKTDWAIVRNTGGGANGQITWYIQNGAGFSAIPFGLASDTFVPADYDGDSKTDLAVWRAGTFYIRQSTTGTTISIQWGQAGDNPTVVGDYDGDGKTDVAVYRPGIGGGSSTWYVLRSSDGAAITHAWGLYGDTPSIGDFDGDGKNDYAVRRSDSSGQSVFYLEQSTAGFQQFTFGGAQDIIIPGDFDGDQKTDLATVRGVTGGLSWQARLSGTGGTWSTAWGLLGDILTPGDYDGDGKTDASVWRPGASAVYYVLQSSTGTLLQQAWGLTGDYPVANFFVSSQTASTNPQMFVDVPLDQAAVTQPFGVGGWAIDQGAGSGTGVDAVHVYACPTACTGSNATFLGAATYGGVRSDVGAIFGAQFTNSGFGLTVSTLASGQFELVVYAHSTVTGLWQASTRTIYVDMPAQTLIVTKAGTGTGTVTSTPAGIDCGSDCSEAYTYHTTVTLHPTADAGSLFTGWTGACTGLGDCVVTMTQARSAEATFTLSPFVTTFYHVDALGSVRVVTDDTATVIARHDYFAFGEDTATLAGDPRRFTGQERDAETALDYFGARYYRNLSGRFYSVDPAMDVSATLLDPQRWNRYSHALGNPLKYVDPSGELIQLIGSEQQRRAAFQVLLSGVDADVASQLYVFGVKYGDETRYFVGIKGDLAGFMSAGTTERELAALIMNRDTVELGITNRDLRSFGGAVTFEPGEDHNKNTRILINPDQIGKSASLNPNTPFGSTRFEGQDSVPSWRVRKMTPAVAAWHEMGHAWGFIHGTPMKRTNTEALNWENQMRVFLYGPLGPANAGRKIH